MTRKPHDAVRALCVQENEQIRDAVRCIDQGRRGIALVVDAGNRFITTVTDGDIRRALLAGAALEDDMTAVLKRKEEMAIGDAVTAAPGISDVDAKRLMVERGVRQLPVLNDQGGLVEVLFRDNVGAELPMGAVIMAGGFGTRLRPLTDETPKPMLPIGQRPLMEHIVTRLSSAGVSDVRVTTHYRPEKIKEHFGDGSSFGVMMTYTNEDEPLGTAGALGLLERPDHPLMVINGDILTNVDPRALYNYHREHDAELTVAVRQYELNVPYGVIETNGEIVTSLKEKPTLSLLVNAGLYVLEPTVFDVLGPTGVRRDMTDVIEALVADHRKVVSFPIVETWIDIGHHDDYQRAQATFSEKGDLS